MQFFIVLMGTAILVGLVNLNITRQEFLGISLLIVILYFVVKIISWFFKMINEPDQISYASDEDEDEDDDYERLTDSNGRKYTRKASLMFSVWENTHRNR